MKELKLLLMGFILSLSLSSPLLAQDSHVGSEPSDSSEKAGGVKSLEDRVKELEEVISRTVPGDRWYDRIEISGLVEAEAGYGKIDIKDPAEEDTDANDVDLATVELNADAKISNHVDGHIKIKYEGDDLFIDEGFITLIGPDRFPAYLIVGRQYLPFGNYESDFITDPNTLVLGETNAGAVVVGCCFNGDMLSFSAGAFNGSAKKSGDDDAINSFSAAITARPFEGLDLGVSYTSNLAGSGGFNEQVVDPDNLDSLVGAWSAFITFEFLERFELIGEYVGAIDSFKSGEIYDAGDLGRRKPVAWNVELGVILIDDLAVALRYGGSNDGGSAFLPEIQYGAVVNWGFLNSTNLALEYLHGEYEAKCRDADSVMVQLAIEF